jgi:hypothetical protein
MFCQSVRPVVQQDPAVRKVIFDRHDHRCAVCGISAGTRYDDVVDRASLLAAPAVPAADRTDPLHWIAVCERCHERREPPVAAHTAELLARIDHLSPTERSVLTRWISDGRRVSTQLTEVWSLYEQASSSQRKRVAGHLTDVPAHSSV